MWGGRLSLKTSQSHIDGLVASLRTTLGRSVIRWMVKMLGDREEPLVPRFCQSLCKQLKV
jgi:hypothetical protein